MEEDDDESEQVFDGDFAGQDEQMLKRRKIKKKKKVIQVYTDPSAQDIKMARAYGGVPRGAVKKVMTKSVYRDSSQTPASITNKGSKAHINKLSGAVSGMQRVETPSRGTANGFLSMQHLEEYKGDGDINASSNPVLRHLNDSQEASLMAVPEHHIRE